jgi:hypothetical protein
MISPDVRVSCQDPAVRVLRDDLQPLFVCPLRLDLSACCRVIGGGRCSIRLVARFTILQSCVANRTWWDSKLKSASNRSIQSRPFRGFWPAGVVRIALALIAILDFANPVRTKRTIDHRKQRNEERSATHLVHDSKISRQLSRRAGEEHPTRSPPEVDSSI